MNEFREKTIFTELGDSARVVTGKQECEARN